MSSNARERPCPGHRLGFRRCARTLHDRRSYVANSAYALAVALVLLLAVLPTGVSATSQTISAYVHSPEGVLLRLAFTSLAIGSALAAYEFWRSIAGRWGRLIAGLTAVWVVGDVIDTIVSVNPVGAHTLHGQIHTVVAVVSFSAVGGTILAFLGWLAERAPDRRLVAVAASALALLGIIFELSVTATATTFLAGTAERAFFLGALTWMVVARHTVSRSTISAIGAI